MSRLAFAVILALSVLGCDDGDDDGGPHKVAVSIFPLYDIARRVAGDDIEVALVLPPGRSEHGYEPTPREMTRVSGADVGFVVGLEMDPWAERIIRSAAGEDTRIVQIGTEIDPRNLSEPEIGVDLIEHAHGHHDEDEDEHHDEDEDEHHEHHHGGQDPHFWLDPVRMREVVDFFVREMSQIDPSHADGYRSRGDALSAELEQLHTQIQERAERWESRTIVTFHGSFGYFADRYDLRIAAVIEPFPGREPTPRYMQEVIGAIRASEARALFSEPQLDPRPATVIARQAEVELHSLDPVGGTDGVETYERLLLHNVEVLDAALSAP